MPNDKHCPGYCLDRRRYADDPENIAMLQQMHPPMRVPHAERMTSFDDPYDHNPWRWPVLSSHMGELWNAMDCDVNWIDGCEVIMPVRYDRRLHIARWRGHDLHFQINFVRRLGDRASKTRCRIGDPTRFVDSAASPPGYEDREHITLNLRSEYPWLTDENIADLLRWAALDGTPLGRCVRATVPTDGLAYPYAWCLLDYLTPEFLAMLLELPDLEESSSAGDRTRPTIHVPGMELPSMPSLWGWQE